MRKLIALTSIYGLMIHANAVFAGDVKEFISSEGGYKYKFDNINERINEARSKIRTVVHPSCKYEYSYDLSGWKYPAVPANAPMVDEFALQLMPPYPGFQYIRGSDLNVNVWLNNMIVHILSGAFSQVLGCDYPVGEVVDAGKRSLGSMPIRYHDEKYGDQELKIPLYISRTNINGVISDKATSYSTKQNMYSGNDFLGNQYYQIIPTKDPNALLVSLCSIHPGTKLWGDAVSGSYIAYYKPHRVRQDDVATAWFTIHPGDIAFDALRVCTLSKLTLSSDGTKNIEILGIKPKFENLKWTGYSVTVDKVKTETWLGNLGGALGFVLGTILGMPVAGWSIGQTIGRVGEDTFIKDAVQKLVDDAVDSKLAEYLNGKSLADLADSKALEAIEKTQFVGNVLKSTILTGTLEQTISLTKSTSGTLVVSPSELVVSRCEKLMSLKLAKNPTIPEMISKALPALCRMVGNGIGVKVYPFNNNKESNEGNCYKYHFNQNIDFGCSIEAKAKLAFEKNVGEEIKALFGSLSSNASAAYRGTDDYSSVSPQLDSLIRKYKNTDIEIVATQISCRKSLGRGDYEKCERIYENEIKPQLQKNGYKSYLRKESSKLASVIIKNPLINFPGELK